MKQFLCILVIGLWLSIAGSHARAQDGAPEGNYYTWNLGSAADMDSAKVPNLSPSDRFGAPGSEGEIKYRLLKPDVFQAAIRVPAFDFDANNYGAVNGVFFLRVRFKDIAKAPVFVHAGKGGCGFYGAGYVGSFGGAGGAAAGGGIAASCTCNRSLVWPCSSPGDSSCICGSTTQSAAM